MALRKYRYTIIGLVFTASIAAFIWGMYFLKGRDIFNKENTFYAIYEKIDGLKASSPVIINGYNVGQVVSISFHPDKSGRLLIVLNTRKDIEIPDSSIARISSVDLMGSKAIELILSHYKTYYKDGDTLYSDIEPSLKEQVSIQMLPVKKQAEDLMREMKQALEIIKYIFNEQTRDNLTKSFENMKLTVENLAHSSGNLDTLVSMQSNRLNNIFANVESITTNLKNNNVAITTILTNFASISDSLTKSKFTQTIYNVNKTLDQTAEIFAKVNKGEGTLGQLLKNDTMYQNLQNASKNLNRLLLDVKENPKKYVRYSLFDLGKTINVLDEKGWEKLKKQDAKSKKKEDKAKAKEIKKQLKRDKKNKNKNTVKPDSTSMNYFFKLQIKSSVSPIPLNSSEFHGLQNIDELFIGGRYKYCIGHEESMKNAMGLKKEIESFFPDAFPIAVEESKVVPLSD